MHPVSVECSERSGWLVARAGNRELDHCQPNQTLGCLLAAKAKFFSILPQSPVLQLPHQLQCFLSLSALLLNPCSFPQSSNTCDIKWRAEEERFWQECFPGESQKTVGAQLPSSFGTFLPQQKHYFFHHCLLPHASSILVPCSFLLAPCTSSIFLTRHPSFLTHPFLVLPLV